MSEFCEHETFKDICGICHRDTQITALRAENERLNKSRNKWGQKYNKLLEKHKVTLSQLKTAVWSDSEECKLLNAENERLRAALEDIADGLGETDLAEVGRYAKHIARAALEKTKHD